MSNSCCKSRVDGVQLLHSVILSFTDVIIHLQRKFYVASSWMSAVSGLDVWAAPIIGDASVEAAWRS